MSSQGLVFVFHSDASKFIHGSDVKAIRICVDKCENRYSRVSRDGCRQKNREMEFCCQNRVSEKNMIEALFRHILRKRLDDLSGSNVWITLPLAKNGIRSR